MGRSHVLGRPWPFLLALISPLIQEEERAHLVLEWLPSSALRELGLNEIRDVVTLR